MIKAYPYLFWVFAIKKSILEAVFRQQFLVEKSSCAKAKKH